LNYKTIIAACCVLGLILIVGKNTLIITDRSRQVSAAHSPTESGPLLPLPAATASIKQNHPKITSSIQNAIDDEAVVIPPITRSQAADFEGYSESEGQTYRSSQPRISEQEVSAGAGWLGMDNSNSYPDWEPSSDQDLIESTERAADSVEKYESSNSYEGWQPIDRVDTGSADYTGYEY
jgi:hypothetical protein